MACFRSPVQPLWSFVSTAPISFARQRAPSAPLAVRAPVQSWAAGEDGRPRIRWSVVTPNPV